MIKVTIDYNKGFDIVPSDNILPVDEVFIDETDLPKFMQNLENNIANSKVYNIKFDYM